MTLVIVFVLLIVASSQTLLALASPAHTLKDYLKKMEGKTGSVAVEEWIEKKGVSNYLWVTFSLLLYLAAALFVIFVVQPIVVIGAIVFKVGIQLIAYFVLLMVLVELYQGLGLLAGVYKTTLRPKEASEEVIEFKESSRVRRAVTKAVSIIITVYTWYLFLVILGVLP